MDKNQQAFFALLRAGLWEKEVWLAPYGEIDFSAVLDLAEEQSVVGLLAAGIEHVTDGRPAKKDVLQFVGRTVQLEQRNQTMNYFIGVTVEKMREERIYTVLVKGQGGRNATSDRYGGPVAMWISFWTTRTTRRRRRS